LYRLTNCLLVNREQLQHKYKQFITQNPSGKVDKETYLRMTCAACGEDTRYMFERIFDVWDKDHDKSVDFKEFITSTSVMLHGDLDAKLRCMALFCFRSYEFPVAFNIYDEDGDGSLTRGEMIKMMTAAFAMVSNTLPEGADEASVRLCIVL